MSPWILYGASIVGWIWAGHQRPFTLPALCGWYLFGWWCWTVIEYGVHRVMLHGEHPTWRLFQPLRTWHAAHHAHPQDPATLPIPWSVTLPYYVIGLGALSLLTGLWTAGLVLSGIASRYLAFEGIHWLLHHQPPHTRPLRTLRRHHLIHHYAEPYHAFGVSSLVWDRLFHTLPQRRSPLTSLSGENHRLTQQ